VSNPRNVDYVLGTHDEELQRLGLQHAVWRSAVWDCWQRGGITVGSRVLDVGAGPGFATIDLAELVGAGGEVAAIERSSRFMQAAQAACKARGLRHVQFYELDLMSDPLPLNGFDAAWMRWVACFVPSPATLVKKIAGCLRPGGTFIIHEYANYAAWRLAPRNLLIEEFAQHVMASWCDAGGEPDIALALPSWLADNGFQIRSATPRIYCIRPSDHMWRWPAEFLKTNLNRMLELGRVDDEWVSAVRREFAQIEANPHSLMITPLVLEIIAELKD